MRVDVAQYLERLPDQQAAQVRRLTAALQVEKEEHGTTESSRPLARWFMLTSFPVGDKRRIRCTSGQRSYGDSQYEKLINERRYQHHLTRQTGNGIELRQYVKLNADP